MKLEFQLFLDKLKENLESEALEIFENILMLDGVDAFLNFKININVPHKTLSARMELSLLGWLVQKDHRKMVQRLIDIGINLEEGLRCEADPYLHNQSPLMLACMWSNKEMVKLLLRAGANILHTNTFGIGMLMVIDTAEICELIIDNAIKNNSFNDLVSQKTPQNISAIDYAALRNNSKVVETILCGETKNLHHAFVQSEVATLRQINNVSTRIGKSFFNPYFTDEHHGDASKETLLYSAARKNYPTVVLRLIELELSPIDTGTVCETITPELHAISPLGIACYYGHIEVMNLLIAKGANLLHVAHDNRSLLMMARTVEVVQILLGEAAKKGLLSELLSLKYKPDMDVISFHCFCGNIDIVLALMSVPDFHQLMPITRILSQARQASLRFSEKSAGFDAICHQLRVYKNQHQPLFFHNLPVEPRLTDCYYSLFGSRSYSTTNFESQKTEAIKSVIAKFHQLLIKPTDCIRYLKFLNDELCRYYTEKHGQAFPVLDSNMYDFTLIEDLYYPIPGTEYQSLEKHKALQELLISIFRKYDMAEQAYQWIGAVPNTEADNQVKQGDFVFEGDYGNGLFHGKFSHMLQRVILIYAIEQGEIDMTFEHNHVRHKLIIQDILEGLVSFNTKDGIHVWGPVKDMRAHHYIEFSDPYRLFSILMYVGKNIGCTALADSLIDNFCKGLRRYYQAWTKTTPFTELDVSAFLKQQDDLTLEKFSTTPALIQSEMTEKSQKRQIEPDAIDHSEEYAIIRKNYQPNEHFTPKIYPAFCP